MTRIVVPDNGTIGSASDTDAITISSSGAVTLSSDFVPATPLSHRNVVINGAMQIWQRGTAEVTISNGSNEGYTTADRFKMDFGSSCAGAVKWSRATEVPDLSGGDMFVYSLKVQTSTANSSPTTNKLATIDYRVEAHDMQRFGWGKTNKKNAVLSFYLKTNKTGVYSWYFQHPGTGTARHRTISFTVSDTNWNRYSIPVSADTVAIPDANTEGLQIRLNLINTPDNDYTSGTDSGWGTTVYVNDDDQVNFLDSTSNILYFTGVQFEIGNLATPFEHRNFPDELRRCQRYYERTYPYGTATGSGSSSSASYAGSLFAGLNGTGGQTTGWIHAQFRDQVEKRASPTTTMYDTAGNVGKLSLTVPGTSTTHDKTAGTGDASTNSINIFRASGTSDSASSFYCHLLRDAEL